MVELLRAILLVGWAVIGDVIELLDLVGFVEHFEGLFVITFGLAMVTLLFEEDVRQVEVAVGEVLVELDGVLVCDDSVVT